MRELNIYSIPSISNHSPIFYSQIAGSFSPFSLSTKHGSLCSAVAADLHYSIVYLNSVIFPVSLLKRDIHCDLHHLCKFKEYIFSKASLFVTPSRYSKNPISGPYICFTGRVESCKRAGSLKLTLIIPHIFMAQHIQYGLLKNSRCST